MVLSFGPGAPPVREERPCRLSLHDPEGPPVLDAAGRARSVQAADLTLTPAALAGLLSPAGLDRLAGAYWRFLRRISLGLIRTRCTPRECLLVFLGRPVVLLAFRAPERVLDGDGIDVRWPITGGLLLSRRGRADPGVLRIRISRMSPSGVRAEVAVSGFAPVVADVFGARFYAATQARIHVLVTRAFLRSVYREISRATSGESTGPS